MPDGSHGNTTGDSVRDGAETGPADASVKVRADRIRTREEFGRGLTVVREQAGLTVRELAKATGIPHSTLGGYLSGRHFPPLRLLGQLTVILGACGVRDPREHEAWTEAFHRARRAPGPRPSNAPVPYRGLSCFEPDDARWFFGRERVLDQVLAMVGGGGVVMVVGPSGSGKSSLLRAGLVARLRAAGQGHHVTSVGLMTPGVSPLARFRESLGEVATGPAPDPPGRAPAPDGPAEPVTVSPPVDGAPRHVVVIDQFEEVFTRCHDRGEREAFLSALMDPDREPRPSNTVVVCGMRADFYAEALRHPGLADALQQAQVVVGPMSVEEVRAAITEPARLAGLDLEEGLVQALLRDLSPAVSLEAEDAAHEPGALPLLSHALLETWRRSRQGQLTIGAYEAAGGIRQAVAASAEAVHVALPEDAQELTRRLFLRLVSISADAADTRRRVSFDELGFDELGSDQPGSDQPGLPAAEDRYDEAASAAADPAPAGTGPGETHAASGSTSRGAGAPAPGVGIDEVVDRFVDARLLTTDARGVQITHEALLSAWPRLRGWLNQDRAGLLIHRQLVDAAAGWTRAGGDPSLLYRAGRLAAAQEWAAEPDHAVLLNQQERRFLAASLEARAEEERAAACRTRRLKSLVVALVVLALTAAGISGYTLHLRSRSDRARDLALSRQLAETSVRLRRTDLSVAAQLAVLAFRTNPTTEARSALLDTTALPIATRLIGPGGPAAVAISRGSHLIAAVGDKGGLRLWNATGTSATGTPVPHQVADLPHVDEAALYHVASSPGGKLLAAAGASGTVHVWDLTTPSRPRALPSPTGSTGTVLALAFSPDGRTLAAGGSEGKIYRWDIGRTGFTPLGSPLTGPTDVVQAITYDPDGSILAAGSADQRVYRWQLADRTHPRPAGPPLTGATGAVTSLAFSPDGHALAGGSKDQRAYVWPLDGAGPSAPAVLAEARSWVNTVVFSPDGATLVVGGSDHHLRVYDSATHTVLADIPHPGPVTGLAYSADGSSLVTGAADGIVRIWPAPTPSPALPTGRTFTLAYSRDGRLAAADAKNEARLFDVTRPYRPRPLGPVLTAPGKGSIDGTLAMTRDGRTLATGGADGSIWLWDTTTSPTRHLAAVPHRQHDIIEGVAISPDGHLLAAACDDATVQLYDISDRTRPAALGEPIKPNDGLMFSVAFSPDGHTLAAASGNPNTVALYDVTDPAHPTLLAPPVAGPSLQVYSIAFSPDGHALAVGSADRTVRLLDTTNPRHPQWLGQPLLGAGEYVNGVAFSPDGRTLAAASGDGTLRLWDAAQPARPEISAVLTAAGDTNLYSTAFSPSGGQVAAGGVSPTIQLWTLDPAQAIARTCANPGDPITPTEWQQYLPSLPRTSPCAG